MTVSLNIENDAELRQYVKDLISGQVKSVVREEIKAMLKDVLHTKIKDTNIPNVEYLMKLEVAKMIEQELALRGFNASFIKLEARRQIEEHVHKAFTSGKILT